MDRYDHWEAKWIASWLREEYDCLDEFAESGAIRPSLADELLNEILLDYWDDLTGLVVLYGMVVSGKQVEVSIDLRESAATYGSEDAQHLGWYAYKGETHPDMAEEILTLFRSEDSFYYNLYSSTRLYGYILQVGERGPVAEWAKL